MIALMLTPKPDASARVVVTGYARPKSSQAPRARSGTDDAEGFFELGGKLGNGRSDFGRLLRKRADHAFQSVRFVAYEFGGRKN